MSLKVYGNFNKTNETIKTVNKKRTFLMDVPVNIPSYLNRKTEAATLKKFLKERDGNFDYAVWSRPSVAQLPDGSLQLYDGDHRRALFVASHANAKVMPAKVTKVNSYEEISDLFVFANKNGRKGLKANEVFVHEVRAGNNQAANVTENHLVKCGLSVSLGTNELNSAVGAKGGPEVQIKGFQKSIKDNTISATEAASKVIISTWTQNNVLPRNVSPELLRGLANVHNGTKSYNRKTKEHDLPSPLYSTHAKQFEKFMEQTAVTHYRQKEMSNMFKILGGKVGNHDQECIALGVLRAFKPFVTNPNYANSFTAKTFNKYYKPYIDKLEKKLNLK
tara:strand:- start:144 stop:1145 length:1002 start_codon:yes stop_codon:yes gene_type:complete